MDLINKYKNELEQDTKINELNLKDAQMMLPGIKHKWVSRLINHKQERNKLISLQKKAKEQIINNLMKEASITLSIPVLEKRAEKDELVKKIKKQIEEQELIILYLDKVENIFKSMTWDIKNLTEIIKLETL